MASVPAHTPPAVVPPRSDIDPSYTWELSSIFPSWEAWEDGFAALDAAVERYRAHEGQLALGGDRLLQAYRDADALGQLAYRVWYYAALQYDEDQRDNAVNGRRQRVQLLIARWRQATSWFNPELLRIPLATVRAWMDASADLAVYRFAIEDLFRQQAHVLDAAGEQLMSLAGRLAATPADAYAALSTADARFPTITLTTGESVQVTYGQYRRLLATCRAQADRRAAYEALYDTYGASLNTYATLYNGVMQREWFDARARGYATTLDAALFGNDIPTSVVENLIREAKAGVAPFRRYHALRKRVLGLDRLSRLRRVRPAHRPRRALSLRRGAVVDCRGDGAARRATTRPVSARPSRPLDRRLREPGQAQRGVLGAGVRGAPVHADELQRHARRRLHAGARDGPLDAHAAVARDAAVRLLRLHHLRGRGAVDAEPRRCCSTTCWRAPTTREERIVLLQHAIDGIVGTFYNQVLFADFELEAHRLVEQDEPVTADALNASTRGCSTSTGATCWRRTPAPARPGRASRTSSSRRTTCISTPPASRPPHG
jgi:oligoendopeptidase F